MNSHLTAAWKGKRRRRGSRTPLGSKEHWEVLALGSQLVWMSELQCCKTRKSAEEDETEASHLQAEFWWKLKQIKLLKTGHQILEKFDKNMSFTQRFRRMCLWQCFKGSFYHGVCFRSPNGGRYSIPSDPGYTYNSQIQIKGISKKIH